jgi:hypothetical protein
MAHFHMADSLPLIFTLSSDEEDLEEEAEEGE